MAVLVAALWPISYLGSPRWEVVVVNSEGQPLRHASVRLVYQNYSAEATGDEITLQTDENGLVLFPAQYRTATLIQRGYYTVVSASAGVHASFGRHAHVFAFGDGYEGDALDGNYVFDWRGHPESIHSKIVVVGH